MSHRTRVIADRKFYIAGIGIFGFAPVTLTLILTRWPSHTNLTPIPSRYTRCAKINFLGQGFRNLSYYRQTDRQTDRQTLPKLYTTPLRGWSKTNTGQWVIQYILTLTEMNVADS